MYIFFEFYVDFLCMLYYNDTCLKQYNIFFMEEKI